VDPCAINAWRLHNQRLARPAGATPARLVAWLEQGQAQLKTAPDGLNDADLAGMRPTNWGEMWPTWRIFWTMAAHDLQHGGEIGCLRDLYRLKHP
jgi:hypothetical protein